MAARIFKNILSSVALLLCLLMQASSATASTGSPIAAHFLYPLADVTGPIRYEGGRVFADAARNEIYVLCSNVLTVFNSVGIEIDRFNNDMKLGLIADVAVDEQGNILTLSYKSGVDSKSYEIIRSTYRAEPMERFEIKNLPPGFADFLPTRMLYREGRFYFADTRTLKIIVADATGHVLKNYDLAPKLEIKKKDEGAVEMDGFSLDKNGNILFTIPVFFSVYRLSPDGTMSSFGEAGSGPGKFGIVSGIIADNRGNYVVSDKLRCVVSVFDNNLNFVTEFGYRGKNPQNLVIPSDLAMDGNNNLYVVQAGMRGVSVFRMSYE